MNEIRLFSKDGKVVVSSRVVAEDFGKRHSDVLEKIEDKLANGKIRSLNYFIESSYIDSQNKERKEYLMTRDGFSFLVMGFTGKKADDFKVDYINAFSMMEQQLRAIAIQSPQAFVDSLKLTKYSIEHHLPNFLTWKNVDEVMPRLIERVSDSVDKGEIKIEVLTAIKNVAEAVYDACPGSAEKEIMARHIKELRNKYDRVLIASNAANTKVKNDSKAKVEELEREVKKAETKRLCDFSEKALKRAYNEAGIIQDIVNKEVNKQIEDDLKESFKANLYSNVKLIVENSNLDWDQAYNAVYRAMGILRHPKGYKHVVDYIWDQGKEWDCIAAAVKVREHYGC